MIIDPPSIILFITFLCNLTIGMYVFYKGPKKKLNRIFSSLILQIALWNFVNLFSFSATDPYIIMLFTQLSLLTVLFVPSTFLIFVLDFINLQLKRATVFWLFMPSLLMVPFIFTNYNVAGYDGIARGDNFIPGKLYLVYTIYFVIFISFGIFRLYRFYKTTPSIIKIHQAQYILVGMVITASVGIMSNSILPLLGSKELLNSYGTSISIFFGFMSAYAITRYRLFDIKFIIQKWLVDIIVTSGVAVLSLIFAYICKLVLDQIGISVVFSQVVFVVILIVCLILTQRYAQRFIARINRIHGLDLSEPDILMLSQGTQESLRQLYDHIQNYFETTYQIDSVVLCIFNWKEKHYQSLFSESPIHFSQQHAITRVAKQFSSVIVFEELDTTLYELADYELHELKSLFKKHHFIYAIALKSGNEIYGFIFLKKSDTDLDLLYSQNHIAELEKVGQRYGKVLQQLLVLEVMTRQTTI